VDLLGSPLLRKPNSASSTRSRACTEHRAAAEVAAHLDQVRRTAAARDAQVTGDREGKLNANPSATSARAARNIIPKVGTQRGRVLAYIASNNGATDHQISRSLGILSVSLMEGGWAIWAVLKVPGVKFPMSSWARSTRPTLHGVIPAGEAPMRLSGEAGLAGHFFRSPGTSLAMPYVAIRGAVSGPNDQCRWSSISGT
jgi:hypothetical protein